MVAKDAATAGACAASAAEPPIDQSSVSGLAVPPSFTSTVIASTLPRTAQPGANVASLSPCRSGRRCSPPCSPLASPRASPPAWSRPPPRRTPGAGPPATRAATWSAAPSSATPGRPGRSRRASSATWSAARSRSARTWWSPSSCARWPPRATSSSSGPWSPRPTRTRAAGPACWSTTAAAAASSTSSTPIANDPGCARAQVDRPARTVTLTVPAACLGDPDWVKVGIGTLTMAGGREYWDDAHRDTYDVRRLKLGPKVLAQ